MSAPKLYSSIAKSGSGFVPNPISSIVLSTKYPQPSLFDVPEDNLVSIASYLSVHDVRALASTCHSIREPLVSSQGATRSIWASQMKQSFPSMLQSIDNAIFETQCQNNKTKATFVDDSGLSIPGLREASEQINLPFLTALLPARYPRTIDPATLISMADMLRYRLKFDSYTLDVDANQGLSADANMVSVVQFIGDVGNGNRCIRSDQPFPYHRCAPYSRLVKSHITQEDGERSGDASSSRYFAATKSGLYSKIKQYLGKMCSKLKPNKSLRPFVVPTIIPDAEDSLVIDITPRLVAYFEVSIVTCGQESYQAGSLSKPVPSTNHQHRCVAIGLSTDRFGIRDQLPGWDAHSYGYHSDDGKLFHDGRGCQSGPLFGPGDTVGCGLEYGSRRMFFTKNGEFLGYAFDKVKRGAMKRGLYPTVGVDTVCPIFVNFGERPFRFNIGKRL